MTGSMEPSRFIKVFLEFFEFFDLFEFFDPFECFDPFEFFLGGHWLARFLGAVLLVST